MATHVKNYEALGHGQTELGQYSKLTLRPLLRYRYYQIELRASLRTSLDKTNQLIALLKQLKKQSRLVHSTLASLKQLQAVA